MVTGTCVRTLLAAYPATGVASYATGTSQNRSRSRTMNGADEGRLAWAMADSARALLKPASPHSFVHEDRCRRTRERNQGSAGAVRANPGRVTVRTGGAYRSLDSRLCRK